MAVTRRASGTATVSLATQPSVTITKPSGVVNGDDMVVMLYKENASPVTPPAGWTELAGSPVVGLTHNVHWFWKVAASEPASWTWTYTNVWSAANFAAYVGNDPTTPMDPALGITNTKATDENTSPTISANGLPVTGVGEALLVFASSWVGRPISSRSASLVSRVAFGTGNEIMDGNAPSSGVTGNLSVTYNANNQGTIGLVLISTGAIGGTVHTVSGRGSFAISGLAWLKVALAGIPANVQTGQAEPVNYYHLGMISWGTANGVQTAHPITRNPEIVAVPSGMTVLHYEFTAGVTATITELSSP